MHAKYTVPISNGSKVIAKFKVDIKQTNERTNRQTNRQDKNNMPPIIRSGGIKNFVENLTSEWKKPTSSYNLVYHFRAYGLSLWPSGLRKKFLEKGDPPRPMFARHWSAFWRILRKNNNTYTKPWAIHVYQVSSKSIKRFWRRSRKCEQFTPDDRRTDARRATRYNNSSLEPSAQVSLKHQHQHLFPHP